ncbi:MAG: 2-polyprenyl-3-methyl-6-methoxy-1,4-benzoquinone monooxygenase [Ectothiorhodospiraceae bacterium]|jgi:ubiquinone biosynthesis monooxygenase Coq7
MSERRLGLFDRAIAQFDQGLRTVFGRPETTGRSYPAAGSDDAELDDAARRESARLMRVNHCGEVCAQALYQGQALTARNPGVRRAMEQAAAEENDHLAWCQQRLEELDSHTSRLNPFFYVGSLALGAAAGAVGDRWSLGFLAETERQVERHLEGHLERLDPGDAPSRAIVEQMKVDEAGHATMALEAGAAELPAPVKRFMGLSSRVMTGTTYWI